MRYDLVVFDVDGTLFDTSEGIFSAVDMTTDSEGLERIPRSELRTYIGPPLARSFMRTYGVDANEAERLARVYRGFYMERFSGLAVMYPGIPELLDRIRDAGARMSVVTHKYEVSAKELLDRFGILGHFDGVYGCDSEGLPGKASCIRKCLSDTNVRKDRCVMVGDSISDLEGANGAGVDFIGALYGFGFDACKKYDFPVCRSAYEIREQLMDN